MFPCIKTVPIEACPPYQNNASPANLLQNRCNSRVPATSFLPCSWPVESPYILPRKTFPYKRRKAACATTSQLLQTRARFAAGRVVTLPCPPRHCCHATGIGAATAIDE